MKIDQTKYKGFVIQVFYNKENKNIYATSDVCNSTLQLKSSVEDNIDFVKKGIDKFLEKTPESIEELAQEITNSLIWDTYEDCHVDATVLRVLLQNFLKTKGIKL